MARTWCCCHLAGRFGWLEAEAGGANGLPKITGKLFQGRREASCAMRQALCCTLEELIPREHDCQGLTVLVDTRGQGYGKKQAQATNCLDSGHLMFCSGGCRTCVRLCLRSRGLAKPQGSCAAALVAGMRAGLPTVSWNFKRILKVMSWDLAWLTPGHPGTIPVL